MDQERSKAEGDRNSRLTEETGTADASVMTEGVGGIPDLGPEERATVSDVDGDKVEEERPNSVS